MPKHKKEQPHSVSPKVLPDRAILRSGKYKQKSIARTYEDINITNTKSLNTYSGIIGLGDIDRTLMGYMLVLSRYSIPSWRKSGVKPNDIKQATLAISHMIANRSYMDCFGADPTNGTSNTKPLVSVLNVDPIKLAQYPDDIIVNTLLTVAKYCGTKAFASISRACANPHIKKLLRLMEKDIYNRMPWEDVLRLNYKGQNGNYVRLNAIESIKDYAMRLLHLVYSTTANIKSLVPIPSDNTKRKIPPIPIQRQAKDLPYGEVVQEKGWAPLKVEKCALEIHHTGRLGRKKYNTDSGTRVRHIDRIVTDPEQRIFSAKTKALGGVVVIDCSGSMNLQETEVERLVNASAGATIVLYRTKSNYPNLYVFAKGNRRARRLPPLGGYNGVDAPALEYSAKLRERATQPIIWISDGMYNGESQGVGENLDKDMENVRRKYNIIQLQTVNEAISYLRQKQGAMK